ncbi:MAG TPA: DsbC family protein [Eoetvoesiella sp.]
MVSGFSRLLAALLFSGLSSLVFVGTSQAQSTAASQVATTSTEQGASVLSSIKALFESRFERIKVTAVKPTPFSGLYEVQLGSDILYTDAKVDYILQGSLIDAKTRRDLTEERLAKLAEISFDALPLHLAIKQVKGNGARKLAVFEDPNCGYCKMLHKTLEQIDNTTVYTLLFPILSPDSEVKARNIWCAKDQAATWRNWMIEGKTPPEAKCETPVDELLKLGRKLMVQGTPAIIFADGSRVNGALPLDALNQKLASVKVVAK